MNAERVELLRQYYKLEREYDIADKRGFWHVARARKYRMNLIEKKLDRIKQKELEEENE